MGQNSSIEWTDHTYNHWIGCTKVSEGCDHCYAESDSKRRGWAVWGKGQARRKTKYSDQPFKWNENAIAEGERRRVFSASLADIFDAEVSTHWRDEFWQIVRRTSALQWLVLTKRAHLIRKSLPPDWENGWKHVCLMTSVENQLWANIRIPQLISVPANYRGLSYEPALGPVVLKREWLPHIHWVIVGGESGAGARPIHPDWVRSMRDQCHDAGIAFFFKQWGCWSPDLAFFKNTKRSCFAFSSSESEAVPLHQRSKKECAAFIGANPQMVFMFRTTKKRAGQLLDGRKHLHHPFDLRLNRRLQNTLAKAESADEQSH